MFDINILKTLPNGEEVANSFSKVEEIHECNKRLDEEYREIVDRPEKKR